MIERDNIWIDKNDHLHLHVIGYPTEGESIVINIGNKFLGVIDCFKNGNCFKTKEVVEKFGGKIDFVCWSHTDWDHTYGLSELEPYFYDETAIIVPGGFQAKEWRKIVLDNTNSKSYIVNEYNNIFSIIDGIRPDLYRGVNEDTELYKFNLIHKAEVIEFSMKSFAPMGKIMRDLEEKYLKGAMQTLEDRKKLYKDFNSDNNMFSVGLEISLKVRGEIINFILTGDLDNNVMKHMNKKSIRRIFSRSNVIKIPHHGSSNSNFIIDFDYPEKIKFDYAITTSYHEKLPEENILNKYSKFGKVINVNLNNEDVYGIAEYEIPLLNTQEDLSKLHKIKQSGNSAYYPNRKENIG